MTLEEMLAEIDRAIYWNNLMIEVDMLYMDYDDPGWDR